MIIPAGFGQVTWIMGGDGLPLGGVCTLGFQNAAGDTASEAATKCAFHWADQIMPELSQDVTLLSAKVKLGPNATGPEATIGHVEAGHQIDSAVPPNVAILVRKLTALGGRSNRGRMFVPGLPDPDVLGTGIIATTPHTALEGAFDNLFAALTFEELIPVLFHTESSDPTPLLSVTVEQRVATQRRRNRR